MKIPEIVQNLELSGIDKNEIQYVKIIPNAIVMKIIGSDMYKNAIGTVVRESIANARDASNKANVTTPLKIHCPDMIEPYFEVQDFGTGMSKEVLCEYFANFGASDKRGDDTLIGGFGIGAGSYICYSGQYTITTIQNNYRIVQQFFKDERGMPCHVTLSEGHTDEPNGTTVKISVNEGADFKKFFNEVEHYCRYLDYPVECNKQINPLKPETFHEQAEFSITKFQTNTQNMGLIIVGKIPYYFDYNQCGINAYYNGVHGIKPEHTILIADIGTVDLIASREELRYTDKTINFIKTRVVEIQKWYSEYLKSKTKFWLHQNTQSWEKADRKWFSYGFSILAKNHGKWTTSSNNKVYSKYIVLDDFKDKIAYLVACKKVGGNAETVAFVEKSYVQSLIALGADPSCIIKFSDLPKQKRGKLAKFKIACLKSDGMHKKLGFCRVDKLNKEKFYIKNDTIKKTYAKDVLQRILEKKPATHIVVDDTQQCGFIDYLRGFLGEKHRVDYCSVAKNLEKLGKVKLLSKYKDDNDDYLRRQFGLIKGEKVELGHKFPLLSHTDYIYGIAAKEKQHAIDYVDYVLKSEPKALENKHLEVL